MEIKICENKADWEKYQNEHNLQEFLQFWDWGEFQKNTGKNVYRWQIIENGEVVGQIQGFEHSLKGLGKYLYVPRVRSSEFGVRDLLNYLKLFNYIFVRFEFVDNNVELGTKNLELVKNRQPAQTLILDLKQAELEILGKMHAKTRYNLHLAEKHGVIVKQEKNAEIFWQLNLQTTGRDKFKSHGLEYYQKMLEMPNCYQLTAYFNDKPIASNILIVASKTIIYLHGASANEQRNLMAPYLLQWQGMKLGKSLGCENYDFWGVAPQGVENHPWKGVTRFKVGFSGEYKVYPKACDIILKPFFYKLYKFAKKLF